MPVRTKWLGGSVVRSLLFRRSPRLLLADDRHPDNATAKSTTPVAKSTVSVRVRIQMLRILRLLDCVGGASS
jgi:hypothetical protein